MASRKLAIEIVGDAASFNRAMSSASRSSQSFGSKLSGTLAGVAKGGAFAAGAAGIGGLFATLKIGYGEWQESTRVAAQTRAVIESTGGIAGVTAKQVDALSSSLMAKSGVDDEAIKSGENLLLTFTGVRNEAGAGNKIFNEATRTMLDMSVALKEGTSTAAIQLGKALNDPIKGVTALQRVGVSFTQGQRDQIAAMVAAGNTMGAQKLILGELNKEFGGSAEAIGNTLPGQIDILKERFSNFAGQLVADMMPTLLRLTEWMNAELPVASAKVQEIVAGLSGFWDAHGETIKRVIGVIVTNMGRMIATVRDAVQLVSALLHGDWSRAWQEAKAIVGREIEAAKDSIKVQIDLVKGIFGGLAKNVKGHVDDMVGWFAGLPGRAGTALTEGLEALKEKGTKLGGALKDGIVAGVTGIAALLKGIVRAALNTVIQAWNDFHIPSVHIGFDTHIPGVGTVGFDTPNIDFPNIPLLDTGGLVTRTGMAVVHRGETFSGVGPGARSPGGGNVEIHIHGTVFGDQDSIARYLLPAVRRELQRIGQRNGTNGLLAT